MPATTAAATSTAATVAAPPASAHAINEVYRSRGPRPSLKPGTAHHHLARTIYDGAHLTDACRELGIKPGTAHCILHRLRKKASAYAGRDVSETYALRLLFDPLISVEKKVPSCVNS